MRILLLTILFLAPLYYFNQEDTPGAPEIDSVKLKMGAPARIEKTLIDVTPSRHVAAPEIEKQPETEVRETSSEVISEDTEQEGDQVHWTDLEEGWNTELKDMLLRLEPADGEEIHRNYLKEQESYQAELDALMNEKQQKDSDEAIQEVDQLIMQLDAKHQERLKDILGAHYEAVRDQYQLYMDSMSEE